MNATVVEGDLLRPAGRGDRQRVEPQPDPLVAVTASKGLRAIKQARWDRSVQGTREERSHPARRGRLTSAGRLPFKASFTSPESTCSVRLRTVDPKFRPQRRKIANCARFSLHRVSPDRKPAPGALIRSAPRRSCSTNLMGWTMLLRRTSWFSGSELPGRNARGARFPASCSVMIAWGAVQLR